MPPQVLGAVPHSALRHPLVPPYAATRFSLPSFADRVRPLRLFAGAIGGRLDHTLSNLNALYQYRDLNITLWGENNLVRLVRRGRCVICPAREREGPACGLVPLGQPAVATSSGERCGGVHRGALIARQGHLEGGGLWVAYRLGCVSPHSRLTTPVSPKGVCTEAGWMVRITIARWM